MLIKQGLTLEVLLVIILEKKKDLFGLMIGEYWMLGKGKDIVEFPTMYTGENGPWGQYMMRNPILTGKVGDLVIPIGNKVKPCGSIDVTLEIPHMVIENDENAVGYQFLRKRLII